MFINDIILAIKHDDYYFDGISMDWHSKQVIKNVRLVIFNPSIYLLAKRSIFYSKTRSEVLEMQKTIGIMTISVIFGINTVYADDSIPAWVKGVAGFWVDGNITDAEFVEAIEFLIDSGIIQVDNYIKESIITEPSPPFTETQNFDRKNIIDAKLTYDDIELSALSKIKLIL